jgi:hypothetical protein
MPRTKPCAYLIVKDPATEPVALTPAETADIEHAFGLTPQGNGKRRRWAFRNRFCASLDTPDGLRWERMVEKGVARRNPHSMQASLPPRTYMYSVTVKGVSSMGSAFAARIPRSYRPIR